MSKKRRDVAEVRHGDTIHLDGQRFDGVEFHSCTFVYSGGRVPVLKRCTFADSTWALNDHAERTMQLMSALYDAGLEDVVDETFAAVRRGDYHTHRSDDSIT